MDLVVTHFQLEGAVLYHNEGNGLFSDVSSISGIKRPSHPYVHWGVHFLDYDNNGWIDLLMVNGHVLDNADLVGSAHAQPALLFRNGEKGVFLDVTGEAGEALSAPRVSRGAAFGDYDDDGDVDVFISNNNGPATLLRNDTQNQNRWLRVRLVGGKRKGEGGKAKGERGEGHFRLPPSAFRLSNRDGIGARVEVWAGGRRQVKDARSGSSYLSQNDLRLHFGLGSARKADSVIVHWPGGTVDRLPDVATGRQVAVQEGETQGQR
jgi:hypothetical protein